MRHVEARSKEEGVSSGSSRVPVYTQRHIYPQLMAFREIQSIARIAAIIVEEEVRSHSMVVGAERVGIFQRVILASTALLDCGVW